MDTDKRAEMINELAESVAEKLFEDHAVLYTFLLETLRQGFVGYSNLEPAELEKLYSEEIEK